jgi:hypothetical protein
MLLCQRRKNRENYNKYNLDKKKNKKETNLPSPGFEPLIFCIASERSIHYTSRTQRLRPLISLLFKHNTLTAQHMLGSC